MPTKIQKNQIATTLLDGWTPADATWTYNAVDKVNVPSGAASLFQKGDRVKFTQTTVKYFVVTAVADTLLTFAVNTDYTVANAAITLNYFSHQANPLGYPDWFATTAPTWDVSTYDNGSGGQPTTTECRFKAIGRQVTAHYRGTGVKAGTNYYFLCSSHSFPAPANYTSASSLGLGFVQTSVNLLGPIEQGLAWETTANITDNTNILLFTFTITYEF